MLKHSIACTNYCSDMIKQFFKTNIFFGHDNN